MARKSRRLGHITKDENLKTSEAISSGFYQCGQIFGDGRERSACDRGVKVVRDALEERGFDTTGRRTGFKGIKK